MRRVLRYGASDRPCRAEPKLWCGLYSRPTTKTASPPSVVLIKKTAHVKIKQQQQAVCIFRGACVREWGQKSAFPQRKNPPTAFTKLLHLFPGWLCSPDCLIFLTVSFRYMQYTAVRGAAAVHGCVRRRGRPLKLPKTRRRKRILAFSLKERPYLRSSRSALIWPFYVVLNKFALWHGTTSKQSTSAAAALSEGRSAWL